MAKEGARKRAERELAAPGKPTGNGARQAGPAPAKQARSARQAGQAGQRRPAPARQARPARQAGAAPARQAGAAPWSPMALLERVTPSGVPPALVVWLAEPSGLSRDGTPFAQVEGGVRGVGL